MSLIATSKNQAGGVKIPGRSSPWLSQVLGVAVPRSRAVGSPAPGRLVGCPSQSWDPLSAMPLGWPRRTGTGPHPGRALLADSGP